MEVLNINELANALKPVVLPGEAMTLQALDVVVTSVLQTPAGRMIFTRSREDATAPATVGHDA